MGDHIFLWQKILLKETFLSPKKKGEKMQTKTTIINLRQQTFLTKNEAKLYLATQYILENKFSCVPK